MGLTVFVNNPTAPPRIAIPPTINGIFVTAIYVPPRAPHKNQPKDQTRFHIRRSPTGRNLEMK
jgi:hypothetical protein